MADIVYDIHAIDFGANGDFGQVQGQSVERNIQRSIGLGSGEFERQFTGITGQQPMGRFSTFAIEAALGIVGVLGAPIAGVSPLTLYRKAFSAGGTRATENVHDKIVISDGIIVPTNLAVNHAGDAVISYEFYGADLDGDGTSPVAVTVNQPLTGSPAAAEIFRLGAVTINGTAVGLVQSVNIDFGLQLIFNMGNGEIFPRSIAVAQVLPVIRVTTFDAAVVTLIGEAGLAIDASDVIIQLRGVNKHTGTSYSTGYQFTINSGMVQLSSYAGQQAQQGAFVIEIVPTKEDALDLLVGASF